jgi:hypothetical protein
MTLQRFEHKGAAPQTTLNGSITAGAGSFTIAANVGYPTGAGGPFVLAIDPGTSSEEKILCSAQSANNVTVAASGRGYDNTVATAHSNGANVQHVLAAIEVDDDNDHIYTTGRDDHTQYARVDATRAITGAQTFNSNITVAGTASITGNSTLGVVSSSSSVTGLDFVATGLTGATAASRYVGATASGAPSSGTFALGDFVIDQTGIIWICTTAGTPGTFTQLVSTANTQNIGGNKTFTGSTTFSGTATGSASVSGTPLVSSGLTGATAASRYVGATASGAPSSGTFAVGDFVIDQGGNIWICTTAGTPGTFTLASIGDTSWTNMSGFTNGFTGGVGANTPRFRKVGTTVMCQGQITGTQGSVAFTYPSGYRPTETIGVAGQVALQTCIFTVVSGGGLTPVTSLSGNQTFDLGSVIFSTL